jgi:molybdopterin converting factor subunit 1
MKKIKKISIKYFAGLREKAEKSEELIETVEETPLELYDELCAKYGFYLSVEDVKVAVNGNFEEMTYCLKSGDALAFIPPMSGG